MKRRPRIRPMRDPMVAILDAMTDKEMVRFLRANSLPRRIRTLVREVAQHLVDIAKNHPNPTIRGKAIREILRRLDEMGAKE